MDLSFRRVFFIVLQPTLVIATKDGRFSGKRIQLKNKNKAS